MSKINKFFDKFKHKENEQSNSDTIVEDIYVDQEFSTSDTASEAPTMQQREKTTTTVKKFNPSSYNDLQQAADALMAYKRVVISFNNMSEADYKRSLNFMSGFVYALSGSINKLEPKVIEFVIRK